MFSFNLHLFIEAFMSFVTLVLVQTANICEFCFTFRLGNYYNSVLWLRVTFRLNAFAQARNPVLSRPYISFQ